eukprot:1161997-Pelagomonas_calceolata.AAC.8
MGCVRSVHAWDVCAACTHGMCAQRAHMEGVRSVHAWDGCAACTHGMGAQRAHMESCTHGRCAQRARMEGVRSVHAWDGCAACMHGMRAQRARMGCVHMTACVPVACLDRNAGWFASVLTALSRAGCMVGLHAACMICVCCICRAGLRVLVAVAIWLRHQCCYVAKAPVLLCS